MVYYSELSLIVINYKYISFKSERNEFNQLWFYFTFTREWHHVNKKSKHNKSKVFFFFLSLCLHQSLPNQVSRRTRGMETNLCISSAAEKWRGRRGVSRVLLMKYRRSAEYFIYFLNQCCCHARQQSSWRKVCIDVFKLNRANTRWIGGAETSETNKKKLWTKYRLWNG